jgi:hypothetical protein
MASQPSWWQKQLRVLPGKRLEAVQGGAGFEGLQNLFFRCSFHLDFRRDFAQRPRRGQDRKSLFSVAKTTFVKSLLRRRAEHWLYAK